MHTTPLVPLTNPSNTSYEVEQFCNLLARIYVRCLQEQDPQVIARLAASVEGREEISHAAA